MRASRLLELLLLLQMRGHASATELADALEVSVRTVYRDVVALAEAGVPVWTETGRNGGVRLSEGYRITGGPQLDAGEARAVALSGLRGIAGDLGLATEAAEAKLLAALDDDAAAAVRSVRDRLLVEPQAWFGPVYPTVFLLEIARAVWDSREIRISYSGGRGGPDRVVRPLGLILKGSTWYLLATTARGGDRLYRVSRITAADVLDHQFERPVDFDLVAAWELRKREFVASIPRFGVTVRVSPDGERSLGLLQEGTPPLPLAADAERDPDGWAVLHLRFERLESAVQRLLQLGPEIEVLEPDDLRARLADAATKLNRLYRRRHA